MVSGADLGNTKAEVPDEAEKSEYNQTGAIHCSRALLEYILNIGLVSRVFNRKVGDGAGFNPVQFWGRNVWVSVAESCKLRDGIYSLLAE